jgi:hypothetical protein
MQKPDQAPSVTQNIGLVFFKSTRISFDARGRRWHVTTANGTEALYYNTTLSRLTGVSRIEAVFRAHVGDDCEVLAASD